MNTTTPTAERTDRRDGLTATERKMLLDPAQFSVMHLAGLRYRASAINCPADFDVTLPYGGAFIAFCDSNTNNHHTLHQNTCDCKAFEHHGACKHVAAVNAVRQFVKETKGEVTPEARKAAARKDIERTFAGVPDAKPFTAPAAVAPRQVDNLPVWALSLL